jgi:DNA-binding XRE family transcriptional regulator
MCGNQTGELIGVGKQEASPSWMISDALGLIDFSVGANIQGHRLRAGLTSRELSDSVGISPEEILTIEAGEKRPSAALLVQIAEALDVSLLELFEENARH